MKKGNPCALLLEMQIGAATVESSVELPQTIKNGSALWLSDFTSRYISKENQNAKSEEYQDSCVHCSVTYNSQDVVAAKVSVGRRMDKNACYIHTVEY